MTRFIITAAALLVTTSAFAQAPTGETKTTTVVGASSTVIAVGDHYTVQSVSADGIVTVKTVVGAEALAMTAPKTLAMAAEPRN